MSDDPDQGVPPDRFAPEPVVSQIGAIPDREYAPFNFSAEDDKLIFEFSASEFEKVLSALRNGAYMTYGDQGSEVYWSFLRNVDYPIMICASVLECFVNDEEFRRGVIDAMTSDPYFVQKMQTLIDNGSIITNPGEVIVQNDDLDKLFGAVTFLVDTMNGANEDLYQALEESTNSREQGQILFEAIPVLETLPFDEVSEYIDTVAEDVAENYDSEYTTTPITGLRDRIRCALFCLARDNDNSLSWQLIADYFWGEVGYSNPGGYISAFRDFVNFFNLGSWPGEKIVYISFANIASVLSQTSKFADMTFPSLGGIMALGMNNPDPDWEILCDCEEPPPPDEHCESFLEEPGNWSIKYDTGTWEDGEGFAPKFEFGFHNLYVHRPSWTGGGMIAKIVIKYSTPVTNITVQTDGGGAGRAYTGTATTNVELSAATVPGWTDMDSFNGLFVIAQDSAGMTDSTRLTEICLYPPDP